MTDLNEKLKLVAEYDGYEVLETGTVTLGQLKKNQTIIPLCDYDSDYQRQIPVWQKVCKDYYSNALNRNLTNSELKDWMISKERYYKEIEVGKPTQSFEILVTAIQFINNLKQK